MAHETIQRLIDSTHRLPAAVAFILAGLGLVLATLGPRFSRSLLTLSMVAAGTLLGLHMPRWFGWKIDPMGTAFGGAIVLGLAGFMLPMLWEGALVGVTLATIGATAVWQALAVGVDWHWPASDPTATTLENAQNLWRSLPVTVNKALPGAIALGLSMGALLVGLFPKMSRAALYSFLGLTVFGVYAAAGLHATAPAALESLPTDPWIRLMIFGGSVFVFAIAGRVLQGRPKSAAIEAPSDNEEIFQDEAGDAEPLFAIRPTVAPTLVAGRSAPLVRSTPRVAAKMK